MKKRYLAALVLAVLLVLPSAGEAYRLKETWQQSFEVEEGTEFILSNVNGFIHIEGWDKNEIDVSAEIKVKAPSRREAEKIFGKIDFEVERRGKRLFIKADLPRVRKTKLFVFEGGEQASIAIYYTVRVPRSTDIELGTVNGDIEARDITGVFDMHATNGDLVLESMSGEGTAHTTNGSVECEIVSFPENGDLSLKSVNGRLVLRLPEDAGGRLDAKTINGKIDLEIRLREKVRVKRSSVKGVIGDGDGEIVLRTVNGSITIEAF